MPEKEQAKHTPGPWHLVDKTNFNVAFLITASHMQRGKGFPNNYLIAEVVTESERTEHNARLITAAPEMFKVLERVLDSEFEPDKWASDVRLVLQQADGIERRWQSAEKRRDDLRVQRAAPELLEDAKQVIRLLHTFEDSYGLNVGLSESQPVKALEAAIAKAEGRENGGANA